MAYSEDHKQGLFLEHETVNQYVYLPGNHPLPIAYQTGNATDTKPFEVVKTTRPGWFRIFQYRFVRARLEPPIPDETPSVDEDLIHVQITYPYHTETNGVSLYAITGVYVYALKKPLKLTDLKRPGGYLYSTPGPTNPVIRAPV